MRSEVLREKAYHKLVSRLFLQTLLLLVAACGFIILLRYLFWGNFAEGIVSLIRLFGHTDRPEAMGIYQFYIRNNLTIIIAVAIIALFLILFRLSLSWFTRYFDEMVAGVENLAAEESEPIRMSAELNFMETKLNEVKTTLKEREEKARLAEQRKNDLVVYLAHDIRTPLTSVIGYLSLLEEAPDMPPEQKAKYVHISLEKAYRLETLINEFFEITRYHFQSVPLHREKLNLSYMVIQLADEMYPLLKTNGQWLETDISEDITIYADADKLVRVFNNILKNAAAYGEKNSGVTVTVREEAGLAVISIASKGEIPEDRLNLIFEKFYRLDEARSSGTGGAGLGLAIAKDIVTLHGGTVSALCEGGKTIFTVALPVEGTNPSL